MRLTEGARLGHYEIVAPLGAGGMGEVYRAKDPRLDREVAIKVLSEGLAQNPEALKRFEREAKALASLSHPGIVSIFDIGTHDENAYVVMELLQGKTLRATLTSAFPWQKALPFAIEVAEALSAAHSKGVIHRDLKPENIFLTSDGRPKILDFGLARLKPVVSQQELTEAETASHPESGMVGTVPYMSPEQLRGESVDARTDIFAFGCVLYEMLAGKRAFCGNTAAETVAAILKEEPPSAAETAKEIPAELDRIIQHCLEKDPARRLHSAHDLAFDLKAILAGTSKSVRVGSARRAPLRVAIWISGLLFALAALLVGLNVGSIREKLLSQSGSSEIRSIAVLPLKNLSGNPDQEYFADGMTDELISKLSVIESLRVISHRSVMEYKSSTKSLRQIAKELDVDAVVEGSVLQAGNRVRILAQLIDAAADRNMWAQGYERDLSDVLGLQNEVASAITQEVEIKMNPRERASLSTAPKVNPAAYQAYLRGLDYSRSFTEEKTRLSVTMFERAIEMDPGFALAYTQLCRQHSAMYHFGFDRTKERLQKAKASADEAFRIAPNLPEAYVALGYYYYAGFKNYDEALKNFAIAQKTLPNNAAILEGQVVVHRRQGRFDLAVEGMLRILERSPRDTFLLTNLSISYISLHKYAEAENCLDRAILIAPDYTYAYQTRAYLAFATGDTRKARTWLEKAPDQRDARSVWLWFWVHLYERNYDAALDALTRSPDEIISLEAFLAPRAQLKGMVYQLQNQQQEARPHYEAAKTWLEKKLKENPEDPRLHASAGMVLAGLGRKTEAIQEGEAAVKLSSKDVLANPSFVLNLARIYALTGESDRALERLEYLLSFPNYAFSVSLLRLDPNWDPLRNQPRFQKLLGKYDHKK